MPWESSGKREEEEEGGREGRRERVGREGERRREGRRGVLLNTIRSHTVVSIEMQIYQNSPPTIMHLFIIVGEHPYDPGKVLPTLGLALVAACMEIACHS